MKTSYRKILLFTALIVPLFCAGAKPQPKLKTVHIADPTIFYHNKMYYLYGTEDNTNTETGTPVLISKDLKLWKKAIGNNNQGYAIKKGRQTFGTIGFWAPQIINYNNKFYMLYTANENIAVAESNSPYGPFTQTAISSLPADTKQIDPYLFIDDDGKKYLYHVRLGGGNKMYVAEFKDDFSGIRTETLKLCLTADSGWEDTKRVPAPPICEGPTVIKRKGIYYLFYSANDFRNIDYAVGYATSISPMGPWKKYEKNPIINRDVIGRNGTGHGDVLKDKKGNYLYVFHAHYNDSKPTPRQTLIVGFKFVKNKQTGIDEIVVDKSTLKTPVLNEE